MYPDVAKIQGLPSASSEISDQELQMTRWLGPIPVGHCYDVSYEACTQKGRDFVYYAYMHLPHPLGGTLSLIV